MRGNGLSAGAENICRASGMRAWRNPSAMRSSLMHFHVSV